MTDTIHTATLTPQEQAAYASGWNRAIEAAAIKAETAIMDNPKVPKAFAEAIRALSMPAPALNMEVCGKCMGTGTAGHPDSGYTCDCDGGMVAASAQAWRDIGTAPKDGTCVILWLKGHYGKEGVMEYWIVNESGDDISVRNGIGSDGCIYKILSENHCARVSSDFYGLYYSGEFDVHQEPFSYKVARA